MFLGRESIRGLSREAVRKSEPGVEMYIFLWELGGDEWHSRGWLGLLRSIGEPKMR
jgi:hypothetical protein